jgi:hypothetical protein
VRLRHLFVAAAVLAGAVVVASAVSGPTGAEPASQSWVGWVEGHGDHHDYSGSPCAEQSGDFCTANIVQYRIAPASPAVAAELPGREGRRTRLWGTLERVQDPEHAGILHVERVEPAEASS